MTTPRFHYIEGPKPELFDITADRAEKKNVREAERRDARSLADSLARIPLNLQQQKAASSEEMARLAALGYLSGPAAKSSGPLRNPADNIGLLAKVQQTFVLNQEGRYRESVELCREILREDPDLVDVYMQMAGDLRRLGRLQESLDAYREALRRSPQLVDSAAIEIANLELDLGNIKAAELNAQQAMKLNPAEAHLILAAIAEMKGDLAGAEREARLAFGREDRPRVSALIFLARILTGEGKLPEALETIDRAESRIEEGGAHPVATVASTRADILARMGRSAEAEAEFRREIAQFSKTSDAYVKLAVLLASQHRFAEIQPTLEAMIAASPTPATYMLAARAMTDLGNTAAARAYSRQAEKMAAEMRQRTN